METKDHNSTVALCKKKADSNSVKKESMRAAYVCRTNSKIPPRASKQIVGEKTSFRRSIILCGTGYTVRLSWSLHVGITDQNSVLIQVTIQMQNSLHITG
jgi:hypothetical protein